MDIDWLEKRRLQEDHLNPLFEPSVSLTWKQEASYIRAKEEYDSVHYQESSGDVFDDNAKIEWGLCYFERSWKEEGLTIIQTVR